MRCVAVLLVAAALLCATASAAPLWGDDGHEVTAQVAQALLTSYSSSQVSSILSGQSLSDVSTWADSVKHTPGYEWSAVLHYINTPDWSCNYQQSRDCADLACVGGAIKNYTSRLQDSSLPDNQITEALKFLTHFAGDIHQPLHVGFTTDEGGNTIEGTFEGSSTSLHMVWDVPLVQMRIQEYSTQAGYASYLLKQVAGPWKANATQWAACAGNNVTCPDGWAQESAVLACTNAYVDSDGNKITNGFDLGDPYYNFNAEIVDMQLAKGGVRLAAMLNRIFTSNYNARHHTHIPLPSNQ